MKSEENDYLYIIECKGGVTKFGKAKDPTNRLAGYHKQKSQNDFRVSPEETFLFLWECTGANVQQIETACLRKLRAKFLNVRSEGFILEERTDLSDMVEVIVNCAMSNGARLCRRDPALALYRAGDFARSLSEVNFDSGVAAAATNALHVNGFEKDNSYGEWDVNPAEEKNSKEWGF